MKLSKANVLIISTALLLACAPAHSLFASKNDLLRELKSKHAACNRRIRRQKKKRGYGKTLSFDNWLQREYGCTSTNFAAMSEKDIKEILATKSDEPGFEQQSKNVISGRVTYVFDGDTIGLGKGASTRIRVFGVDCPEAEQPYGARARRFTESLVLGKKVTIYVIAHDKFDRLVGNVVLKNGRHLNRELLSAGLAWHYTDAKGDFTGLERKARAARKGLWSQRNPVPPREYRERGKK